MLRNIKDVIKADLCIACGACSGLSLTDIMYVERHGIPIPQLNNLTSKKNIQYCPGKGYEIVKLGQELYKNGAQYDVDLGFYRLFCAARTMDQDIAKNASSGGVITAILSYMFHANLIQGALVTTFAYGSSGPTPLPYIAKNKEDLLNAQGSKYCPVGTLNLLRTVRAFPGKVAWVGTPCQIAGLRLILADDNELRDKIPFTIANFCGGFRDFREARRIAELCKVNFKDIVKFQYRGGGQPGFMRIETCQGMQYQLPYPDYVMQTGYTKLKRCRLCIDAMGELADFACGDAWIPRFLNTKTPWSIVLTRSAMATEIIQKMKEMQAITTEEISLTELKRSQHDNIRSKKTRQHARRRLYSFLGSGIPLYDGGYEIIYGGIMLELRIHCTYWIFTILEKIKLYKIIAKVIGRYPKDLQGIL